MTNFSNLLNSAIQYVADAGNFLINFYNMLPSTLRELLLAVFVLSVGAGVVLTIISILR